MKHFVKRITVSAALALASMSGTAHAQADAATDGGPVLSGSFDLSVLNDYVTQHGLVATTRGGSVQTVGSATLSLPSGVSFTGGVWTDFNPSYDKIGNTTRTVNETDPFFAISVNATKRLTLTAKYIAFIGNNLPKPPITSLWSPVMPMTRRSRN